MGDRCRVHSERGAGICSLCLTQRLVEVSRQAAQENTGVGNNVYVQAAHLEAPPQPLRRSQSVCIADEFQRKTRKSFSLLALLRSDPPTQEDGTFISMEVAKPASWISSLLRKSSKRKEASKRNSFSGRPSLDHVLGEKMASYENELARRQEALKAGGWEVQLSPPGRRCTDCDAEEKNVDTGYFSDSSVVTKRKIRSLFGKERWKENVKGVCKEKKNPRVANCMLARASENGGADNFGVRKTTSWAKTLASPLWKPKAARKKGSFPSLRQGSSSQVARCSQTTV